MKILIVEDNRTDLEVMKYLLQVKFKKRAEFFEAGVLKDALSYLQREDITCVILDLQLPDSSGVSTFQAIADDYPQVPVVIVTNNTDQGLALETIRRGAADFILKNFTDTDELFRRVVFAVERYHLQKEAPDLNLEDRHREIEQFMSITSHDLREPLNSVAGLTTLLIRKYGDRLDDKGREWLGEILTGTSRMAAKIEDLLLFSRTGRDTPIGEFPIGAAVEEAEKTLARPIKESGAVIQMAIAEGLPMVCGDRGTIAQVFQNLFSNAIKYKREAPRIKVSASKHHEEGFLLISIQDNGLGFDMQFKDRIFGVFQRLYTVEEFPGTGIGLAIAKKIIDRHKGVIWAESKPGIGSTFFLKIPSK